MLNRERLFSLVGVIQLEENARIFKHHFEMHNMVWNRIIFFASLWAKARNFFEGRFLPLGIGFIIYFVLKPFILIFEFLLFLVLG